MQISISKRGIRCMLIFTLLFTFVCSIFVKPRMVYANPHADISILFIIDKSLSMSWQDPNNLTALTAVMLIDSLPAENTEVAFIAYNDTITHSFPFTQIDSPEARGVVRDAIMAIPRRGSTDMGRALRYGVEIFANNPRENPIIILLSDGEKAHLRYTRTGRTVSDSNEDRHYAMARAYEMDILVYTIGVSIDGAFGMDYMLEIAQATGGNQYLINNEHTLPYIFREIMADIAGTSTHTSGVETILIGGREYITIDTLGTYASEVNIVLNHSPGTVREVISVYDEASIYASRFFTTVRIQNPSSNQVLLRLDGTAGSLLYTHVTNHMRTHPRIELPSDSLTDSGDVTIWARLFEPEAIPSLYYGLTAELSIHNITTGYRKTVQMENTGEGFKAVYHSYAPHYADFTVTITDGRRTVAIVAQHEVGFGIKPPIVTNESDPIRLILTHKGENTFYISDYFYSASRYTLTYTAIIDDGESSIIVEGSKLIIEPTSLRNEFIIIASDEWGGEVEANFVATIAWWIFYRMQIIIAVIASAIILIIFLLLLFIKGKEKPTATAPEPSATKFRGARLEGYFLDTLSGNEIPVLNWSAGYIENKSIISLGSLFNALRVEENLSESEKIYFEAGNNNTLVFHHDTQCIVSMGRRDIPPCKKVVLNYDDRIYIVFEDHVTEIEVRYKRARITRR